MTINELQSMTKSQVIQWATEAGFTVSKSATKKDVISLIDRHYRFIALNDKMADRPTRGT